MIKLEKTIATIIIILLASFSIYAQENPNQRLNIDSTERDNTRVVKEKNIPDTLQNNTTPQNKAAKKNKDQDTMYLVPDKQKRKSDR